MTKYKDFGVQDDAPELPISPKIFLKHTKEYREAERITKKCLPVRATVFAPQPLPGIKLHDPMFVVKTSKADDIFGRYAAFDRKTLNEHGGCTVELEWSMGMMECSTCEDKHTKPHLLLDARWFDGEEPDADNTLLQFGLRFPLPEALDGLAEAIKRERMHFLDMRTLPVEDLDLLVTHLRTTRFQPITISTQGLLEVMEHIIETTIEHGRMSPSAAEDVWFQTAPEADPLLN